MKSGCAHRGSGFAAMGLGFARHGFAAIGLGFTRCRSFFFFFCWVVGFAHSHALQWWWCRQWVVVGVCVHSD